MVPLSVRYTCPLRVSLTLVSLLRGEVGGRHVLLPRPRRGHREQVEGRCSLPTLPVTRGRLSLSLRLCVLHPERKKEKRGGRAPSLPSTNLFPRSRPPFLGLDHTHRNPSGTVNVRSTGSIRGPC